jgi:hypothetical protein
MKRHFYQSLILTLFFAEYAAAQNTLNACTSAAWRHNCRDEVIYENSDRYVGGFFNNKRHFSGTYFFVEGKSKGDRYEGEFKEGYFDGKGIYYFSNGRRDEGEFKVGEFHGQGIQRHPSGESHEGEFKANKKSGFGVHVLPDKSRRVGEWVDGAAAGEGIYYLANGQISQTGRWENNKLVKSYPLDASKFPINWTISQPPKIETSHINAGWALFIGSAGNIDEFEALRLTAEGMRAAEEKNNRQAASIARNNLGVIHKCSRDPRVRDYELGESLGARETGENHYSNENFLWNSFLRRVPTREHEFLSYVNTNLKSHSIAKLIALNNGKLPRVTSEAIKLLERAARAGDHNAAKWIAYQFECSEKPIDLVSAEQWYSRAHYLQMQNKVVDERELKSLSDRLQRSRLLLR